MGFREEALKEYREEVRRKEEAEVESMREAVRCTKEALQKRLHVAESEMREIPEEGIVEVTSSSLKKGSVPTWDVQPLRGCRLASAKLGFNPIRLGLKGCHTPLSSRDLP